MEGGKAKKEGTGTPTGAKSTNGRLSLEMYKNINNVDFYLKSSASHCVPLEKKAKFL